MSLTVAVEMSTAQPEPTPAENLELPLEELLKRGRQHLPYGDQVIDDLTAEEADAFIDAVLSRGGVSPTRRAIPLTIGSAGAI